MDKPFEVFDFHRIFWGDAPPVFLLEIVFRTLIMYAYAVFLLRVLGKRGMGQFSMLELAIIICFGSAVGDPMIGAYAPIMHGIVAITAISVFQIALERFINHNPRVEAVVEGRPNLIVDGGVINWDCMKKDNISKEDLFRALRNKDVEHLGQVQKAFFETSGTISVFFQSPKKVKPGLSLVPEEMKPEDLVFTSSEVFTASGSYSCMNCGYTQHFEEEQPVVPCTLCAQEKWSRSEA